MESRNSTTAAPGGKVTLEPRGDVALIIIDNPPINAGSTAVRQGILAAIHALAADDTLRGAVLIGAGKTFIAGSDLREFGMPLEEPQLPSMIAAIEACPKPVVAALHGAALGGGYELALGCDARIAAPGTLVGLPEVTLGIVPGAGGTQRLPRLVGPAKAIELICSGRRVPAEEALALGMIDAVADGDLATAAIRHLRTLAGNKTPVIARTVPQEGEDRIEAAARAARKAGRERPPVIEAIRLVRDAARLPADQALAAERALFQQLRISEEAFALRHQFFAERSAMKVPDLAGVAPRPVTRVAVIGAGTMGSGIAIAVLNAGLPVTLVEVDAASLERGAARIGDFYQRRVATGRMPQDKADACLARLRPILGFDGLGDTDLIIEAVFEDLSVKTDLFGTLAAIVRPDAILATNTSYLDVDAIARATGRPENVLGLHFFSPAHAMRLIEVVRGEATAPDVLATGIALGKALGKLPVVARNAFGFIGNRIYAAYRRQCEFMLEEGGLPETIDAALEDYGFAMGPFAVADMSGLDIAWRMRQQQAAGRDPAARYVDIPDRLCEAGRLGRKTGAGYYRYDEASGAGRQVDPDVTALVEAESARKGIVRTPLSADAIQRRVLLTMVNEAALLMAEGVALRADDIDLVLVNGYGFPKWRGGPVFWARRQDREDLLAGLRDLADTSGAGFRIGDPALLGPEGQP